MLYLQTARTLRDSMRVLLLKAFILKRRHYALENNSQTNNEELRFYITILISQMNDIEHFIDFSKN